MTRSVRKQMARSLLLAVSMVTVAWVIAWLTGWSFLYVSLALLSGGTLVLYWLKSRRRSRATDAVGSRSDMEQKA